MNEMSRGEFHDEARASAEHVPVMLHETLALLRPCAGGRYVDGTLGGGGHAEAVLEASAPDGQLLGIDRDEEARRRAARRLERFASRMHIVAARFDQLGECLEQLGWDAVDGILLDLGVSSFQLDEAERGFAFTRQGPLDMRMDRSASIPLGAWLHGASEAELRRVLRQYGEEPHARRIARALVAAERRGELCDTASLAALVARVVGRSAGRHPATRTFQALRIAVNGELESLERFLADAYRLLRPGGRLVAVAYHSLEDRLVKQAFRLWGRSCLCPSSMPVCRCNWSRKTTLLTPRPLRPSGAEVARNPRARSARLRAVERLAA
jgi:16S rRNA (cytosine1402-N4)-methyltransferase